MKHTLLTTTTAVLLASTTAHGETITFSHWVPATHQVHNGVELWAKSIEDASGGDLTVRIFPAQQLGKAQDHYDMIASPHGIIRSFWVRGKSPRLS